MQAQHEAGDCCCIRSLPEAGLLKLLDVCSRLGAPADGVQDANEGGAVLAMHLAQLVHPEASLHPRPRLKRHASAKERQAELWVPAVPLLHSLPPLIQRQSFTYRRQLMEIPAQHDLR